MRRGRPHTPADARRAADARRLELALRAPGIGFFDWDLHGDTVSFSASAQRIYGFGTATVPVGEAFARVHPDDLPALRAAVAKALDPAGSGELAVVHRFARGDGHAGCVEILAQVQFEQAPDGARRPSLMAGVVRDSSVEHQSALERQRLIDEVERHRRWLDVVLRNASVAVFVMDERQHCTYMNPAAELLTGYTLAETQGRPLHDVIHHTRPDGRPFPLEDCAIDRAFPERMQVQGEETFVRRDGSFYPVAYTASPIRDEFANTVGTIIEVRDIRHEKEVLETLRDADRRKDEFLAMLAHELRNPLSPIVNAVEILRRLPGMPDAARPSVAMIGRQAAQMRRLVDDLLEVNRISRGAIELKRAPTDLGRLVAETVDATDAAARERRHALRADLPPGPVSLVVDPVRLRQVLENLLSNAVKYTPEGGRIEVALLDGVDAVQIRVSDTGIGIAPERAADIFELFSQGEPGVGPHQGGLGIGLALARQLVGLHGGTIAVHSDGPGRGSTFTVRLPRG